MSCLELTTKIAMMLDELLIIKDMLSSDVIRPDTKARLEEEKEIVRKELKGMYFDLFKLISN